MTSTFALTDPLMCPSTAELGVVAYAGEESTAELAGGVVELAERWGVTIPDDAGAAHWPAWIDLV